MKFFSPVCSRKSLVIAGIHEVDAGHVVVADRDVYTACGNVLIDVLDVGIV